MATFTVLPDNGCSFEVKPNVRVIQYGDGYEQRQGNGINMQKKVWTLKFSVRTDTEADVVENFLKARGGIESFDWIDPNGAVGKYVCRSWGRTKDKYNLNTVSASFEQVFEL